MSTPIVNFNQKNLDNSEFSMKNIGVGALKLYMVVSVPLVVLTLLAWWAVSFREKRKEKNKPLQDLSDIKSDIV